MTGRAEGNKFSKQAPRHPVVTMTVATVLVAHTTMLTAGRDGGLEALETLEGGTMSYRR